ncbi:MAG: hypothetical protein AB9844_01820 [Clostridiaceae bacterium]
MSRLTQKSDNDIYLVSDDRVKHNPMGFTGDAIEKLARFEDLYDELILKQKEITEEMEKLRLDGKMHTARFRQLMNTRIANNTIIILFESCGCDK